MKNLILILAILSLFSCSKKNDAAPTPSPVITQPEIKTLLFDGSKWFNYLTGITALYQFNADSTFANIDPNTKKIKWQGTFSFQYPLIHYKLTFPYIFNFTDTINILDSNSFNTNQGQKFIRRRFM